jgi:coenzyme F420 hydrogenase subunit beta
MARSDGKKKNLSAGVMHLDADELAGQCVGCGLCASLAGERMHEEGGYMRPGKAVLVQVSKDPACCPVLNMPTIYDKNVWGRSVATYIGWSTDSRVRHDASSGGILTSVLLYLLDSGKVDAVMQVGPSETDPLFSEPKISLTSGQVLANCGSRYVSCDGLGRISEILNSEDRWAVVGRPCEIRAVRQLMETDARFAERIPYLLSFFCAGAPSRNAVRRLDRELNPCEKQVESLRYRGDGWPGYATETFVDGESSRITYDESWGKILGRDLESYCRFCFDGVGEYADISAGDAWHQNEDGTPDFGEHDGRNVVFGRTDKGASLLVEIAAAGGIHLEYFDDWDYLDSVQKYQFERKVTLATKLRVFRLMGKKFRSGNISQLAAYSKRIPLKKRIRNALGLVKRIVEGRVRVP